MRYIFDVTCDKNENTIRVEIAYGDSGFGSIVNNVVNTIFINKKYDYPNINETIFNMIDNLRLTVKEREEAIKNANIFINYIADNHFKKDKDQIILEEIK